MYVAASLGIEVVGMTIMADSSAAIGICRRTGIGRVWHLAAGQLWVQARVRAGGVEFWKHPGQGNPADSLAKGVARELTSRHTASLCLSSEEGWAAPAPIMVE